MAQRKPAGKKPERKEQSAAQSTLTSPYNTMIPLLDAAHVYVKHPVTRELVHCSTSGAAFLALMKDLFEFGIGERLMREFEEFAGIDARWRDVAARVDAHVNRHAEAPASDADAPQVAAAATA